MNGYAENGVLVLQAGRRVLRALDGDEDERHYAVKRLLETAEQTSAVGYQAFSFRSTVGGVRQPPAEVQIADDVLASLLMDISTANVVLAAGYAVDAEPHDARYLNNALRALESSNALLEQTGRTTAFGFKATAVGTKTHSSDVKTAVHVFAEASERALDRIVTGAESAMTDVFAELKKLDPTKVLEALGKVGQQIVSLSGGAVKLIRRGLELLQQAINRLVDRLGTKALEFARTRLEQLWGDVQTGTYARQTLAFIFSTEGTRTEVRATLAQPDLSVAAVDVGTDALVELTDRFDKHLDLIRGILRGVTIGLTLLAFTPLAAGTAALAGAACYATVLAAIILIGMDFSDSGHVLEWVNGVGQIAKGLL